MPLTPGSHAPYGPPAAVTTIIDGYRDRGLGTPITVDVLSRVGVSESLITRTRQSIRLLELIDDDGNPSGTFDVLREARGEDFNARGEEWLRSVYADVLQYADPSTDSQDRIAEAFRGYQPNGQRNRMATLLVGLWEYVGLPVLKPEGPKPRTVNVARRTKDGPKRGLKVQPVTPVLNVGYGELPPALVGLLHQIPRQGASWTVARRDEFLKAFAAVLDFSVPIGIESSDSAAAEGAEVEVDSS